MRLIKNYSLGQKQTFTELVGLEWGEDFSKIEEKYNPDIILAVSEGRVVAGIAVFKEKVPEGTIIKEVVDEYRNRKIPYLGYFVVDHSCRGQGIGSAFMQKFLKKFPSQKFWLVIEDLALQRFYEKNGFHLVQQIKEEKIFSTEI